MLESELIPRAVEHVIGERRSGRTGHRHRVVRHDLVEDGVARPGGHVAGLRVDQVARAPARPIDDVLRPGDALLGVSRGAARLLDDDVDDALLGDDGPLLGEGRSLRLGRVDDR